MASNDINLSLIERYFDGDLDEDERAAFQQKLESDPAFAEAFRLEQDLHDGIEAFGNRQLRAQLEAIHREEAGKAAGQDGKIVPIHKRWMWIAAAVLLGVALLARLLFDRPPTPQQLYAIYAVHEFDFTEKSAGDNSLSEAEQLLKEGKYREALPVLERYLETHPGDGEVLLAKGVAMLETGEFEGALAAFREAASASPLLENDGAWYEGLTYLKQENLLESRDALAKIPETSARFKNARQLLESLENLSH